MTLTRRERIMVITGLIVVIFAAYIFYFMIPQTSARGEANSQLLEAQTQLNVLKIETASSKKIQTEIETLNEQLKTKGGAIPTGLDHAGILLYLKKLTDSRTENVNITVAKEIRTQDKFLLQDVTVEFHTSYTEFLAVLDDLKKNELYGRASFIKVDYAPAKAENPAATSTDAANTSSPTLTADKNILSVRLEMSFYAIQPADGEKAVQPLTPSNGDRGNSLFPLK